MLDRLSGKSRIRIRKFRYSLDMIYSIDKLGNSRSGYIPIIILDFVEVDEGYWNMPIFAIRGVGYS